MAATTQVLKKLQLLQELVAKQEKGDEVLEATISKLLHYELEKLKDRQIHIREKLTAFEEKYGLKTEEFFQQFRKGSLGDELDFFEWSALAEMEQVSNGTADLGITQ